MKPTVPPTFGTSDDLLERLTSDSDRVVYMIGSAVNLAATPGAPGVPGVSGVVDIVRDMFADAPAALARLDSELAKDPTQRYQAAFSFLLRNRGQEAVNDCVRRAVVRARIRGVDPSGLDEPTCGELEGDREGWHLSPAVTALGRIQACRPPSSQSTVLTPNFDPLLEIGIKRAGREAFASAFHGDGNLDTVHGPGTHVAHLHGQWRRSDTLHTVPQLEQFRPELEGSLGRLLGKHVLLVLAYGGWDDVFTRSLIGAVQGNAPRFDVLWAFYEADPAEIGRRYTQLLGPDGLRKGIDRGRVILYHGIDAHDLLPKLADVVEARRGQRSAPGTQPPLPAVGRTEPAAAFVGTSGVSQTRVSSADTGPFRANAPRREPPQPLWRCWVGIGTWKSEPVVVDETVIFPVAGAEWGGHDRGDGLVARRMSDGLPSWRAETIGDANALCVDNRVLYVGTDAGHVYAVDADTGDVRWTADVLRPVLARPVVVPAGVLVCSVDGRSGGTVHLLDRASGVSLGYLVIEGGVVADPLVVDGRVFLSTRAGGMLMLPLDPSADGMLSAATMLDVASGLAGPDDGFRPPIGFHGSPIRWGDLVIQPVATSLTDRVPVVALSHRSLEIAWAFPESCVPPKSYGNARARPAIAGDVVVLSPAYTPECVAVTQSGVVRWETRCGLPWLPQWAGPVAYRDTVYVPRFSGMIHALAANTGERRWAMTPDGQVPWIPESDEIEWKPYPDHAPLNATPVIHKGVMFGIDSEGYAYALRVAEE
ncbi:MAG: PQQ-binding-like beta-propeller repeat protein [Deltaproteobacteria bacterium]|nr:PQQ-binding-like beta-propeller repeat protein [Deltaproteobacteria bacterium]